MAAIGQLMARLALDTSGFTRGLSQAQTRVQSFSGKLGKSLGQFGSLPGISALQSGLSAVGLGFGAAAAAAVAGLGAMSISTINAASEINQLAQLAGSTPEEFQKIAYAADQVGISQEKMGDILKDVNDRVGDFIATGGGPMKDFFEKIAPKVGVTAQQFRNLSGPQALQLYVSSLEKANVNQQDFTFFMEAMASDSTALVPLLRNGGAAAQAYADRLETLGGVMSNETVAALAKMKTSLNEVGTVAKGMMQTLGAAFAPAVDAIAKSFVQAASKGGILRAVFDGLASVVGHVGQAIGAVVTIVMGLIDWVWQGVAALASWGNSLTGLGDLLSDIFSYSPVGLIIGFANLITSAGGFGQAMTLLGQVAADVWGGIVTGAQAIPTGLSAVWATVKAGFQNLIAYLQGLWAGFLRTMAGSLEDVPGMSEIHRAIATAAIDAQSAVYATEVEVAALQDEAETLAATARDQVTSGLEAARAALERLRATSGETEDSLTTLGNGQGTGLQATSDGAGKSKAKLTDLEKVMKKLREEAEKLAATMTMTDLQAEIWDKQRAAGVSANSVQGKQIAGLVTQIDGMKRLKDATEDWSRSISGAMANFITKGGSFKDVLSDIISKFADMLANEAFTNIMGGSGGKGLLGGVLKAFGVGKGAAPAVGKNANGTPSWKGGLTEIHERGGEIIDLPEGSRVIPHDISKRMADQAGASFASARVPSVDLGSIGAVISDASRYLSETVRGGFDRLEMSLARFGDLQVAPALAMPRASQGQGGDRDGGGMTVIRVELDSGLIGQILDQAGKQSAQIVQANNRTLPDRIKQYQANPRARS